MKYVYHIGYIVVEANTEIGILEAGKAVTNYGWRSTLSTCGTIPG